MPSRASKSGKKRDFTQIAKAVIDQVTDNLPQPKSDTRNPHAVALSKLGASKGGKAKAKSLPRKKRREIAKKAARARWKKR